MEIRNLATSLTGNLMQKDYEGEGRACLGFVRDRIRYVRDIAGVETLHDPVTLLRVGSGDCDDKSILLASLLLSIGHKVRFVAIAFRPDQFSHVWVQAFCHGRWVDLEPTEPIQYGERIPSTGAVKHIYQEA